MALSRLDNLYRQVILDHSSHPHHHGILDASTNQIELNNPTCGDVIQIQLVVEQDIVKDIRFSGSGCSISTASASMMTDAVIGKTREEALALVDDFSKLVLGEELTNPDALGDAQMLSGVAKFPARIKCATLGWKALEKALTEGNQTELNSHLHCD
ncbi:SUF system NifU family Fe-S cluster assembly protein [Carnobacterium divergens]|uniref:SUF system NifU family Fe-S cluster assembly protein n=1 Tax=Carnobacterium divergens TaxID=2748 RepID=A0A2R8A2B4_CARDV|nr:SUF system NifU family Fe-S cluster assembly protein [Carnobacterium divergens]MCO6017116.1 SUF system NifU family Fe-S cluster assembly protein [Carnobacterium divergens]MDT1958785.1 SUF system NifU family Fe-S cluster assembly protein [Carnobacterium divergens]MDT1974753.1 SUF system NifU family Fe-S cluster assembly protein [Carnobacterium divergens]TFI62354.1 SUF system NifU family Fe-S cluster assembly protein [Carnobacterium divergens]TFI89556.1 SUF system NifU family Fe-S cluster ass